VLGLHAADWRRARVSPLTQRIAAATVLIPLVVAAVVWLPGTGFALVLGVFAAIGAREWCRVGDLPAAWHWAFQALIVVSLAALYVLLGYAGVLGGVLAAALAWWLVALAWVIAHQHGAAMRAMGSAAVRAAAGWLVLVPAWVALVCLHQQRPLLVLYLLVLIWVADSAAFFAGRRFGRRKLATRVSPGKSWEGVAAALLAVAVLAAGTAGARGAGAAAGAGFVALSLAVAIASVVGDLTESLFKRRAGVKDSGTLIPGHGGVLDRIDSLTAAGPCFAAGWLAAGSSW
jgi:phosphatidate cytidylyltransferase